MQNLHLFSASPGTKCYQMSYPVIMHLLQLSALRANTPYPLRTVNCFARTVFIYSSSAPSTMKILGLLRKFPSLLSICAFCPQTPYFQHPYILPHFFPPVERSCYFPCTFWLHIHPSPRHTNLAHSCFMTSPPQPSNANYH